MSADAIDVDISGFRLRFEGTTPELSAELKRQWPDYVSTRHAPPALTIRIETEDRTMTPGRFMEGVLEIKASRELIQFRADEGEIVQNPVGATAIARLALGDPGRRFWGLVNLACAAVGWQLLARGGGALHAAGVLIGESAYLLVGPSGSGKSTWAKTAADAGLPVLSDDCVLLDLEPRGLVALGSPFRSKELPSPGPGRWPVAAILVPQKAAEPSLAPVSRLMLEARIAANLLFSATAWESQPAVARAAGAIAGGAPARVLSFRPDSSWIPIVTAIDDRGGVRR